MTNFLTADWIVHHRPVVIRSAGHFVKRVDPLTRTCTDETQQFRRDSEGGLTILPRSEWITDPEIVDVDGTTYR